MQAIALAAVEREFRDREVNKRIYTRQAELKRERREEERQAARREARESLTHWR